MERFADFVVNNKIKMALTSLLMAFIVFVGIANLKLDTDGRVFMASDNPDKMLLDNFEQKFAKDDMRQLILTGGPWSSDERLAIRGKRTRIDPVKL